MNELMWMAVVQQAALVRAGQVSALMWQPVYRPVRPA